MSTIQEVLRCINQYQGNGYNSYLIQMQRKAGYGKDDQYEQRHRLAKELAKDVGRLEDTVQGWADLIRHWNEFLSAVDNCMSGALRKMVDEVEAMEAFQLALQASEQLQQPLVTAVSAESGQLVTEQAMSPSGAGSPHSHASVLSAGELADDEGQLSRHVSERAADVSSFVQGSPRLFSTVVSPLSSGGLSVSFDLSDSDLSDAESMADEEGADAVLQNRRLPIHNLGLMAVVLGQIDAASKLLAPTARAALQCNRMTDCFDRHTETSPSVDQAEFSRHCAP